MESYNYRDVIKARIRQNAATRGYKSQLARAAGCQMSYFSQVLKGVAQLTPDQASALCDFWKLDRRESDYFITLVNYERAGTPSLKKRLKEHLVEIRHATPADSQVPLSEASLDFMHAHRFYSNWHYSAIHTALEIDGLRQARTLAPRFNLSVEFVETVLEKLRDMGLAKREGKEWKALNKGFAASNNNDLQSIFHSVMRMKANQCYLGASLESLHYTTVCSISEEDYLKIRELLNKTLKKSLDVGRKSDAEEVVGINLDLFKL